MNKRIRELEKLAYTEVVYFVGGQYMTFNKERFAELIIKECERISLACSHRHDDMGAIIAKQIKDYFGVE